jgi:general secretion pathway protein K
MKESKGIAFNAIKGTALIDNKGAAALVLVVWVVVVLMAIVGQFAYSMRTEINIVRNFKEEEEAYQRALAGVEQAKLELLAVSASDIVFLNEEGKLVFKDDKEEDDEEEVLRSGTLGNGSFEYTIIDEDSKLNINAATEKQLEYLLESTGVDAQEADIIADSVIDWRDPGEEHHLNGAEEDYYQSLDEPYSSKDGLFETVEELLLVKGMTPEILYGSKGEDIEESYEGVAKYLTVNNIGNININTASSTVLEIVIGQPDAGNIMIQRESAPIPRARSRGKVTSFFFTIVSTGTNSEGTIKRTVKTVIQRKGKELKKVYWSDNVV